MLLLVAMLFAFYLRTVSFLALLGSIVPVSSSYRISCSKSSYSIPCLLCLLHFLFFNLKTEGIVLICATNLLGSIDSALLRPGRVDKTVYVPLPSLKERQEVKSFDTQPTTDFNFHLFPCRVWNCGSWSWVSLQMLEYYASRMQLSPDVDLSLYASLTSGLTGADVANLLNLAAIRAASNGKQQARPCGLSLSPFTFVLP